MSEATDNQSIERAEFISREKCPTCSGSGAVYVHNGPTDEPTTTLCPTCNGTAHIYWCESCHGYGTPSGEAAGLVCGNCMGTGIEPEETPD
jgi:DnaJ-class molecular chaperone